MWGGIRSPRVGTSLIRNVIMEEGRMWDVPRGLSRVLQKFSKMETRAWSTEVGEGREWDKCPRQEVQGERLGRETSAGKGLGGCLWR